MNSSRPHTHRLPAVVVIGAGRMGRAMLRAGTDAGIEVSLAGRGDLPPQAGAAEIALLCVPDAEIANACRTLLEDPPSDLRYVGHTSGASGLEVLSGAGAAGLAAFSVHPLQTVPDEAARLGGAPAAVEGSSPAALAVARDLAIAIGLRPFELPENSRAAYHAAASMASNFLVALEESAVELLRDAGIEDGRDLLAPLVVQSVANWVESGAAALTGPIARGDELTVRRHSDAVERTSPALTELYGVLAERTRAVARGRAEVGA
ncbi:MAG: DUF2520 domain-containing protein [Solirubrobacterales bacterium]|nr:DUF2520 domain-containing protein [Solirubrobacterales bacterium]